MWNEHHSTLKPSIHLERAVNEIKNTQMHEGKEFLKIDFLRNSKPKF